MKIRRLSEVDLARFLSYQIGPDLDQRLRSYNAGAGPWSYEPVRFSTADIVDAQIPFLGDCPKPSWDQISNQIQKACKRGKEQIAANVEVGKLLFDYCKEKKWKAVKHPMSVMPIGLKETVRFWCDVVVADEDGPFIPFFDQRRDGGITNAEMRKMVFSMQNIWLRERDVDLAGVRLAVVRFPMSGEQRFIKIDFHNEQELLPYEQLNQKVQAVYEAWARVSSEKTAEQRKTGTGGNPFGF